MEVGDTFPYSQPVLGAATSMDSPLTCPLPSTESAVRNGGPMKEEVEEILKVS